MSASRETGFSPALIGSVALHGLVVAAVMIGWPWKTPKPITLGESVPVTIVSEGPTNVRPAQEAPEEQTAQAEDPTPEAQPEPPAPVPAPTPTPAPTPPTKSAPKPTPAPTPAKKPAPAKANEDFFASLEASLAKTKKSTGKPTANAPKGPNRAETSVQARPAAGAATGLSAAALGRLQGEVQDRWNPACNVEGVSSVTVRVVFEIGPGGRIVGQPQTSGSNAADSVVRSESDRAVRALFAASPFAYLPSDLYGQKIALNFNAKEACSR